MHPWRPHKTLIAPCLILLLTLGFTPPAHPAGIGQITTVPMEKGFRVQDAVLADLNADGLNDLLVACSENRREDRRQLRIHIRTSNNVCFPGNPDFLYEFTPDVIAFSTGDFIPPAGADILLFTVSGVYAWNPLSGPRTRPTHLLDADFLWQLPDSQKVFYWEYGGTDWNNDGHPDLMVPEPNGFRLALQIAPDGNTPKFFPPTLLGLPKLDEPGVSATQKGRRMEVRNKARQLSISLSLGDVDPKYTGTSISVRESLPAPLQTRWDGNASPDIIALGLDELFVWPMTPNQDFLQTPTLRMEFPVALDAARFMDVSFSTHATDLNRDNKTDCVILAGDRNSSEARTQVLIYVQEAGRGESAQSPQNPLFGPKGIPQQLLLVGGFAGMPQLEDVNGDQFPDLFLSRVQLTSMEAVRAATSGTINADLLLYLNHKGTFSRQPDATMTLAFPTDGFSNPGSGALARFIGDVSGNGMRDLIVRDQPGRLQLFALGKTRSGLGFTPRPVFETSIVEHARIRFPTAEQTEILVLEGNKTVHVRLP